MPVYNLIVNGASVQSAGSVNANGGPNQGALVAGGNDNPGVPSQTQGFIARLDGVGACSATVQPVVSMDGNDWTLYGSAQLISGGSVDITPAKAAFVTAAPYPWFGGYVASISGTSAKVNLKLSA